MGQDHSVSPPITCMAMRTGMVRAKVKSAVHDRPVDNEANECEGIYHAPYLSNAPSHAYSSALSFPGG